MTQFPMGTNLDHARIQITTLDCLGPFQTNMMNLFVTRFKIFGPFTTDTAYELTTC